MATRMLWLTAALAASFASSAQSLTLETACENEAPQFIRRADGSFGGLCVALMSLITADSGIAFRAPAEVVPKKRYLADLESGAIDVQFSLRKDAERRASRRRRFS